MAEYKYLKDRNGVDRTDSILRTRDNANIPENLKNNDWVAYQAWLAVPNTPDPSDPEDPNIAIQKAIQAARKAIFNDKNLNTKDRLDAVIEYLGLDI